MENEILRELRGVDLQETKLLQRKLSESTSSLKLDAVQAAVAEALIRWSLGQPEVQQESSNPNAVVNWIEMGGRALDVVSPAVAEAKSVSLEGLEAAAAVTLIDWAIKQPAVAEQAQSGLLDYVGIGSTIIASNKAVQATPEDIEVGKGAEAPIGIEMTKEIEVAPMGAPELAPELESKMQDKCKVLAEKIVIFEFLKAKKELTEKEKALVEEVEGSKITEKEFFLVKKMFEEIKKEQELKGKLKLKNVPEGKGVVELKNMISEAVWDFGSYTLQELFKIRDAAKILEDLGVGQDEEMLAELKAEINKRADK